MSADILWALSRHPRFAGIEPLSPPWDFPVTYRVRLNGLTGELRYEGQLEEVLEEAAAAAAALDEHGAGASRFAPAQSNNERDIWTAELARLHSKVAGCCSIVSPCGSHWAAVRTAKARLLAAGGR